MNSEKLLFANVKKFYYPNGDIQIRLYKNSLNFKSQKQKEYEEYVNDYQMEMNMRYNKNKIISKNDNYNTYDNDKSLISSMNRTRNMVLQYARSNSWDYFITLTFNNDIVVDNKDYEMVTKKLKNFIDTFRRKNPNMKYLGVPERFIKGGLHFHFLFANVPNINLIRGTQLLKNGKTRPAVDKNGNIIYNVIDYKLGWTTATVIKDSRKTAFYLSKYITKELAILSKNKKRYWNSKNLDLPVIEYENLNIEEVQEYKAELENISNYKKKIVIDENDYQNEIDIYEINNIYNDNNNI